jgi:hypothetical protein
MVTVSDDSSPHSAREPVRNSQRASSQLATRLVEESVDADLAAWIDRTNALLDEVCDLAATAPSETAAGIGGSQLAADQSQHMETVTRPAP